MTERSVALPSKLRVDAVSALRDACLSALEDLSRDDVLKLDCSEVSDVDATGLQLLYALRQACSASGVQLELETTPEVLSRGSRILGLGLEEA
ncbi:MAG: STAS domain-containing protein [Myxococcota bacterium]